MQDRRRDGALFRYSLIREAADPALMKAERGRWSAPWPPATTPVIGASGSGLERPARRPGAASTGRW